MSLKVWLPLTGNLENKGCSNIQFTNTNGTIETDGKIGSCYYLSTSAVIRSELFTPTNVNMSICGWIKNTGTSNGYLFGLSNNAVTNGNAAFMLYQLGGTSFRLYGNSAYGSNVTHGITVTEWHHYALTYDGTYINLYIDGVYKNRRSNTFDLTSAQYYFILGARDNGSGNFSAHTSASYYNDIRYYDHCLSAAEVHEISQGLVLHYKLATNNLINKSTLTSNYYINSSGGLKSTNKWYASDYIPIEYGKTYQTFDLSHGGSGTYIAFYNENKTYANRNIGMIANENITFTPQEGEKFVRVSIRNYDNELAIAQLIEIPTIIQDNSGYGHNGTILSGTATLTSNSARYSTSIIFNGFQNPTIDTIDPSFISVMTNCTITWWEYVTVAGNNLPIVGQDQTHYIGAGSTTTKLYHRNTGLTGKLYKNGIVETSSHTNNQVLYSDSITYTQNQWTHFALSGADISSWTKFRLNNYSSSWPVNGYISDVRLYVTALSETDIKQLYEMGGKVDNKQNLHIYEAIEMQPTIKLTKQGQMKAGEFQEDTATKFYETDQIIETNNLIEL